MKTTYKLSVIKLLILCILPTVLLTQCKEKEYPVPEAIPLPSDFKEWMFFKEGTYWVYQDSATGALDSVVVTRVVNDTMDYREKVDPGRIRYRLEYILNETASSLTGRTFRYVSTSSCYGDWRVDPKAHCYDIAYSDITEGDGNFIFGGDRLFHFQFYRVPVGYVGNAYVWVKARYDTFQLGDNTFHDVVVNWQSAKDNEGGLESWYTLAKGVGIIQRRHRFGNQTATRTLLRYHIQQ